MPAAANHPQSAIGRPDDTSKKQKIVRAGTCPRCLAVPRDCEMEAARLI